MRGAFGLISLLICAVIVAYLWASNATTVTRSGSKASEQATQLSGHDAKGESALKSITTQGDMDANGHVKGLLVTDVVPGGAMESYYGLKKGDKIVSEGDYEVGINDDASMASAMLLNAFERFQQLEVIRDGQKIKLPQAPAGATTQPASPEKMLDDASRQLGKIPEQ